MKINVVLLFCCALLSPFSLEAQDYQALSQTYLARNASELGFKSADANSVLLESHTTSHNGATHIYVNQAYKDIPVYNKRMNLLQMPNGEIRRAVGDFVPSLKSKVNTAKPKLTHDEAIRSVLNNEQQENFKAVVQCDFLKEATKRVVYQDSKLSLEEIVVALEYFPVGDEVRLAWKFSIHTLGEDRAIWDYHVDAVNGKILNQVDRVLRCHFGDGHNHYASNGISKKALTNKVAAPAVTPPPSESYLVYPLFTESPQHGERTVVTAPWLDAPNASPFGWHDTNGEEGAEFTITRGNNVFAQDDRNGNNGFGAGAQGGDDLVFDFPVDLEDDPITYTDASETNLFYWCNVLHDVWYEYGFDEESGNFQTNNYDGFSGGGDALIADTQDGSGANNANFSASPDGASPRLQMFEWGSQAPSLCRVTSPASVAGDYDVAPANFGGLLPLADDPLVGLLVLVDDGSATPTLACEEIENADEINGNIALVDRGDCLFVEKTAFAQDAGAIAVVICNNEAGGIFSPGGGTGDNSALEIPTVMISQADCAEIRMELPNVRVELSRTAGSSNRDSAFDNGVVSHEYGHGISIRLTGGANTFTCLGNDEQQGEGWSDFFGLVMTTDESNIDAVSRGLATYLLGQDITGDGLRTFPYSRNMNINPHTYADIQSEAIPHGVGSVWCAMIWDLYLNLVDVHGFSNDLYAGDGGNNIAMQLVMDGLKLQPCSPGFVDARDAILLADQLNNGGENECLIWETFARRGLGFSAEQGDSDNRSDGNEAFDTAPSCDIAIHLEKTTSSTVAAGASLEYSFELLNNTQTDLEGVFITDELPEGLSFINESSDCATTQSGNELTIDIGSMSIGETVECSFRVNVSSENFSEISFIDDIEELGDEWSIDHGIGDLDWDRVQGNAFSGNVSWFAADAEPSNDQYLIFDASDIDLTSETMLTFYHDYNTEATWDGGVVEISFDGENWQDLGSRMIENGYNSQIQDNPASAISGRQAFSGSSNGYIRTRIDLSDFAMFDFFIRFRMACDEFVAAEGWYIEDVEFGRPFSIENTACAFADGGWESCSTVETQVLDSGFGTGIVDEFASQVSIYPNPAQDELNVSFPELLFSDLRLSSLNGQILQRQKLNALSTRLDISSLIPGVYILELLGNNGSVKEKVVVF